MSVLMWIGFPLVIIGAIIITRSTRDFLDGESRDADTTPSAGRRAIGQGIAALGAILVSVGALTGDSPGLLKALIVAAVVFLLAVLIWATASNRQGQQ